MERLTLVRFQAMRRALPSVSLAPFKVCMCSTCLFDTGESHRGCGDFPNIVEAAMLLTSPHFLNEGNMDEKKIKIEMNKIINDELWVPILQVINEPHPPTREDKVDKIIKLYCKKFGDYLRREVFGEKPSNNRNTSE